VVEDGAEHDAGVEVGGGQLTGGSSVPRVLADDGDGGGDGFVRGGEREEAGTRGQVVAETRLLGDDGVVPRRGSRRSGR
jgi:hypothetical protein